MSLGCPPLAVGVIQARKGSPRTRLTASSVLRFPRPLSPNVMKVGRGGAQHGEGGALPRPSGGKMAEVEVLGEVEGEVRACVAP